ncbi:MAG: hypothetical protein ACLP22_07615 [Solirubrobacteraceae bacterium]
MIGAVPDHVPRDADSVRPTIAVPEIDGATRFRGCVAIIWVRIARPDTLGAAELSVAVIVGAPTVLELVIVAL